jgi:hypothetical protein
VLLVLSRAAFVATQPTNHSKGAQADVLQARYGLACQKHFWDGTSSGPSSAIINIGSVIASAV